MSTWDDRRPTRTAGMSAKEEILARVRSALAVPRRDEVTDYADVPRAYQRADDKQETGTDPGKVRDVLVQRLEDYTTVVHRTTESGASSAIARALGGAATVVVPAALPGEWTEHERRSGQEYPQGHVGGHNRRSHDEKKRQDQKRHGTESLALC